MILQNLYNKVIGFFRQTDIQQEESSKEAACNRLRVVLMQDRTNLTPELLEKMRGELVELLSKYLEMDKDSLELNLEQDGDQVALMLSIPVIRAKDEEEIKEAEKELEEKDSEDAENDTESEDNPEEETDEVSDEVSEDVSEEISDDVSEEITQKEDKESSKKKD